MLTPHLEKLILCGKASFNSLAIGGSEKTILNVAQDRYIIITDITINHHLDFRNYTLTNNQLAQILKDHIFTQLSIFSDRSYNHYIIKNDFNIVANGTDWNVIPFGSTKLDTFLIHNNDVAFSWIKSINQKVARSNTPAESVGRPLPFDYGKEGQPVAGVVIENTLNTVLPWVINQGGSYTQTNDTMSNELQYPVTDETFLLNFEYTWQFPTANINYVEVFGNLDNISATL